eukprot:878452-Rhodomonas_salina.4
MRPPSPPTRSLFAFRYLPRPWIVRPCLPTGRYAMSGTERGYAATRSMAMHAWGLRSMFAQVPISLPACYAVSGTDIAQSATCLRSCYAQPGPDIVYGVCLPTRLLGDVRH